MWQSLYELALLAHAPEAKSKNIFRHLWPPVFAKSIAHKVKICCIASESFETCSDLSTLKSDQTYLQASSLSLYHQQRVLPHPTAMLRITTVDSPGKGRDGPDIFTQHGLVA